VIVVTCAKCGLTIRSAGDGLEHLLGQGSDWYPDRYPCPRCAAKARILVGGDYPENAVDLNPEEMFAAFHGLGMPAEREFGETVVRGAMNGAKIRKVHTRSVGKGRCCVDRIELEDGTTLYLGASTYGAVVYRMSAVHSYADSVLKDMESKNAKSTRCTDSSGAAKGPRGEEEGSP